jgi:RHS repeat-associated protein
VRNWQGGSKTDCPFRYQGQYEDAETGLYYNRFRYYSPDEGMYLSQDPIGLAGNNPTLYGYVRNVNNEIDELGLDLHHIIPNQIYREFNLKQVQGYVQNVSKKALDKSNLIKLDQPFHGNHPAYSDYVRERIQTLSDAGKLNNKELKKLQDDLISKINDAKQSGNTLNDYFKNKVSCS